MINPEQLHISNIIQSEQVVYTYVCMCLHRRINERRGCEFGREQGGVYGRNLKEREEGNNIITLQSKT